MRAPASLSPGPAGSKRTRAHPPSAFDSSAPRSGSVRCPGRTAARPPGSGVFRTAGPAVQEVCNYWSACGPEPGPVLDRHVIGEGPGEAPAIPPGSRSLIPAEAGARGHSLGGAARAGGFPPPAGRAADGLRLVPPPRQRREREGARWAGHTTSGKSAVGGSGAAVMGESSRFVPQRTEKGEGREQMGIGGQPGRAVRARASAAVHGHCGSNGQKGWPAGDGINGIPLGQATVSHGPQHPGGRGPLVLAAGC